MLASNVNVLYPDNKNNLDQNEEFVTLVTDEGSEKIRIHDYDRMYSVPGLYEAVVHEHLKCDSPRMICTLFKEEIPQSEEEKVGLRVLDFGAGNGLVGECLSNRFDCDVLIGLDIIPEAREAAFRDRPDVYDEYYVMDLGRPSKREIGDLEKWRFNTLMTVAALGYGDIPTEGFINAFNMVEDVGWIVFNIKDRFLSDTDESGYNETLKAMMGDSLQALQTRRYCHRLSMSGEPLHYYAVVGRKVKDIQVH